MSEERRDDPARSALVTGGTGAVGAAVVERLAARGLRVTFVYGSNDALARDLERRTGAAGHRVDLRDRAAWSAWLARAFVREGGERGDGVAPAPAHAPDVMVHAAGVLGPAGLEGLELAALDAVQAVNVDAALLAIGALAPSMRAARRGSVVLVGALDRGQSLPIPPAFAASQGALAAAAMALGHALGRDGVRVNVVAAGLLERGLGAGIDEALRRDFLAFSGLRRLGRPDEIAAVVAWLALDERAMTGKVVPVNGGLLRPAARGRPSRRPAAHIAR